MKKLLFIIFVLMVTPVLSDQVRLIVQKDANGVYKIYDNVNTVSQITVNGMIQVPRLTFTGTIDDCQKKVSDAERNLAMAQSKLDGANQLLLAVQSYVEPTQ